LTVLLALVDSLHTAMLQGYLNRVWEHAAAARATPPIAVAA
jgi:hypothetical protein